MLRGRRINLLLALGRSRRLLFRTNFRDGAATIKVKAESGLLDKADDMLPLPSAWTFEAGLPLEAGIP